MKIQVVITSREFATFCPTFFRDIDFTFVKRKKVGPKSARFGRVSVQFQRVLQAFSCKIRSGTLYFLQPWSNGDSQEMVICPANNVLFRYVGTPPQQESLNRLQQGFDRQFPSNPMETRFKSVHLLVYKSRPVHQGELALTSKITIFEGGQNRVKLCAHILEGVHFFQTPFFALSRLCEKQMALSHISIFFFTIRDWPYLHQNRSKNRFVDVEHRRATKGQHQLDKNFYKNFFVRRTKIYFRRLMESGTSVVR